MKLQKKKVFTKADWLIKIERLGYRRHTWSIPYPLSKYALVGLKEYATEGAAKQAAYRIIRQISHLKG